jgi:hypothetical protein
MQDCLNVRIRDGKVMNEAMGWENFPQFASSGDRINLDYRRVQFIDEYRSRAGATTLLFCNDRDIFRFNASAGPPAVVEYMTPIYAVGTAAVVTGATTTTVTGGGPELWDTAKDTDPVTAGYGNNVKAGDFIAFGINDENQQDAAGSTPAEWYEIDSVTDNTHLELVAPIAAVSAGPYTIRQCLTGIDSDIFRTATFQDAQDSSPVGSDVYYMTNGIEMLSWNGLTDTFDWFYPGFIGRGVIAFKQTLVFWNLLEGGQEKPASIAYSQLNHPNNFATLGASRVQPADGVLDLLEVIPIGDQIVCYFQDNIVLMQHVGAPIYFIARVAVPGVGLVAQRAMMDFGDYHEFLGRDAAYRFDGVTLIEAMNQVFREVLRQQAPNRIKNAYAHIDEEWAEVIWSVPLASDGSEVGDPPTTAYVEHYIEDVGPTLPTPMTIREFPFTAMGTYEATDSLRFSDFEGIPWTDTALRWNDRSLLEAFPFQIAGDDGGNVWILNTVDTQNESGFNSFARFRRMAAGDGEIKGLVKRLEPYTTRRAGSTDYALEVTIRFFDFADGDSIGQVVAEFDMTHQGLRYVPIRKTARYCDVMFRTYSSAGGFQAEVAPARPWELSGYEIKVSAVGDR